MVPSQGAAKAWAQMNTPSDRHRIQGDLDELIWATEQKRPINPDRAEKRYQDYANVDDEFDKAWRISHP